MRFKQFLESGWDDFFNEPSKKVTRREEKVEWFTLPLYRGFNGDLRNLKTEGDYYIFSPTHAEQGMLWFTHPYIRAYNPIEYAKSHGDWFFKYDLMARKHIEVQHHEDGTTYEGVPPSFMKKVMPSGNSRFHAGIELPEGWVFSYKHEKFIGCKMKIKVRKEDVVESVTVPV